MLSCEKEVSTGNIRQSLFMENSVFLLVCILYNGGYFRNPVLIGRIVGTEQVVKLLLPFG